MYKRTRISIDSNYKLCVYIVNDITQDHGHFNQIITHLKPFKFYK